MFSEPTSHASSEEKKKETANTPGGHELELLLADSWNRPLR
jgi:hypothetical protein